MRLQERIDTINVVRIPRLTDGHANTIGDFYTQVIGPMLPTREVVLAWQGLIYDYASDPDAIFFLRRYQSASRKDWTAIRRGFLTEYARGGYVCCDNFFAHYFYAMAIDGFVLLHEHDMLLQRAPAVIEVMHLHLHPLGVAQRHQLLLHGIPGKRVADTEDTDD